MHGAGGGNAVFVDAGADRGFDVLAAAGARISLPFTPGRNHRHSPATFALATIFIKSSWPQHRLCWNLNVLLQKIGTGKNSPITLSWMLRLVTAVADIHRKLWRSVA